jgi:RNA polymerase sigma-70 factor (ECF subfamily)
MTDEKQDDERWLARRLLSGDKKEFRRFYRRNQPRLLAYVLVRVKTREDAEEIVQDVFLGFLDALPLFGYRSSLWTFLVSIARHEIADYFRRLYAKRAIRYVPFVEQLYREPMLSADETVELLERALLKLKPLERELIVWKYEEEMSVKDIAGKLGIGVKAAESKLFRARQAFKAAYVEVQKVQEVQEV